MTARSVLTRLMRDPLISSFLLRGDYVSERKSTWLGEPETEEEKLETDDSNDSDDTTDKTQFKESGVTLELKMEYALVQFTVDLILNFEDDEIVHEMERIQSKLESQFKRDFFSSFVSILENSNSLKTSLSKVIRKQSDPMNLYSKEDLIRLHNDDVEKQLPIIEARVQSLCVKLSDRFLAPDLSFETRNSVSKKEIEPPFVWLKGGRRLSELILFLSVGGWLKLNPKVFDGSQSLSIGLTQLFLNKESQSARFTKKPFLDYFLKLPIEKINNMQKKDLYKLPSERMQISEREPHPFDSLIKHVN